VLLSLLRSVIISLTELFTDKSTLILLNLSVTYVNFQPVETLSNCRLKKYTLEQRLSWRWLSGSPITRIGL